MKETDEGPARDAGEPVAGSGQLPARKIDPSEAVTLFGFVFGAIGAVVGIVAALIVANSPNWGSLLLDCISSALAGGSAGIVIGGMIGAIVAVTRGVARPRRAAAYEVRRDTT